jgi:anti-sigma factor RsiW
MTNRPLSSKDLEILSAYLDDQLKPGEVKRLETRLSENSGLSATLEDLKRTRLMVRSLPKVRAPRNFTLSPQMVAGIQRPARSFWQLSPSWGMVSAISVMLLMIALMGDLMGVFTPAPLLAATYAGEATSLTAEMQAMEESVPEMALISPEETLAPEEMAVSETSVVSEANLVVPEADSTQQAEGETARAMENLPEEEDSALKTAPEEMSVPVDSETPPSPYYTPAWVRAVEFTLLGMAVIAAFIAVLLQRKA